MPRRIFGRSTRRDVSASNAGPSGQGMSIWVSRVSRLRCRSSGSDMAPPSRLARAAVKPARCRSAAQADQLGENRRRPFPGAAGDAKRPRCVRVAQQDRAQDSLLVELGVARGNGAADPLKVGESCGGLRPADPEPSPGAGRGRCRDWTGGTYRLRPRVKGQSRPRTPGRHVPAGGGESRSGMNPGAVGSNPAADTTPAASRPDAPVRQRPVSAAAGSEPTEYPGTIRRARALRWRVAP